MALNPAINNNLGALPIDENYRTIEGVYRNMASGNQTVVTAGVPVQLTSTPTQAKKLDITANENNAGAITIGGSAVVGALSGRKGVPIYPTNTYSFAVTDLSQIWIDSTNSGDGCTFNYFW